MTSREAISTIALTLLAVMGAIAVPLMAESSWKIIIGSGLTAGSLQGTALLVAMGLDPRSRFGPVQPPP